ncbi:MAG TPA: sigma-70 family RNA polymerase sigma factor [Microlunatus sp.]
MNDVVASAVAEAHRRDWARVLAATVRVTHDLDLAEECTQDAYAQALQTWPTAGVPERPAAWLTRVAGNRALDVLRRESVHRRTLPMLAGAQDDAAEGSIDDDRLRLVFTCCHPALSHDARVALTLRLVCGLSTAEVARAFLVQESTMAARLTRAKKKILAARIPYRVPPPEDLDDRIDAVLTVVHLIFTTGHTAPAGRDPVRPDLIGQAIALCRLLRLLMPSSPQVSALLALLLLNDARTGTRVDDAGHLVLLPDQDRTRWDRDKITEGTALLNGALARAAPTRYAVEAAIAAAHAEAPSWQQTDWTEIVALYDVLGTLWPSPVVQLNRAIALGHRDGPAAGLAALDVITDEPALAAYGYLSAARADFLHRLGRRAAAEAAYREALMLAGNQAERDVLQAKLTELGRDCG